MTEDVQIFMRNFQKDYSDINYSLLNNVIAFSSRPTVHATCGRINKYICNLRKNQHPD